MAEIVWPMVLRGVLPELPLALLFGAAAATGADAIATAASVVMAATLNFTEILLFAYCHPTVAYGVDFTGWRRDSANYY